MTHTQSLGAAGLSANDAFKLRYPRYLKISVLAALLLTALVVALWPDVPATPYRLRENTEIIWVDIPDPEVVPEPPPPVAAPRIPPVIEAAPESDPQVVDIDWEPIDFWNPAASVAADPSAYDNFQASSSLPGLTHQAKAEYPEIARRSGLAGTVVVNVLVGVDGRVDQAVVSRGAHPLLDKAALAAALKCRFTPAKQREVKVKVWVAVPYRFRLD